MTGLLDHNPVPATGPRNLTVPLAAWLRKMGFTVYEFGGPQPSSLSARWIGLDHCYDLTYCFVAASGSLRLTRTHRQRLTPETLVDSAYLSRQREARFLLLSSEAYSTDRQQALTAGTLLPAHAQPVA